MESMVTRGEYMLLFGDPPKIKIFNCTLKFLLTQDHMGLEIFKWLLLPQIFIQFQPNFIVSMLVMREYKLLHFLPKESAKFKIFMAV